MTDFSDVGKMAYSKSGRDEGRAFIILGIINEDYVYISDGDLRPIEKPKKKKIKHLIITDVVADEIKSLLQSEKGVSNGKINSFLQSMNSNEEV